jgi:hypothetical protein
MIIIYVVFGIAVLIGIWALTCLISALVKNGGPLNLVKEWLRAIRGRDL